MISTLGALTGIAAGTQSSSIVVLSGLVIVTVESLSMAAGSYLSSKAHRQYLEHLLREEEKEIARNPEAERSELKAMYRQRGFTDSEIAIIEKRLFSNKKLLLEDMAHKELGICPDSLEEPLSNAFVMGTAYVAGGLIPVTPYLFLPMSTAMPVSVGAALAALFIFGGWKGKIVHQTWWHSGLEMFSVASAAAAVGFLVGTLLKIFFKLS